MNQAGIDTEIITKNLTIIIGAFVAAVALEFGLGSREVIADLLKGYYTRKNFEIGQLIEFDGILGTILSIDNITMTIETSDGIIIVPIRDVVNNRVSIKK